MIDDKEKPYKDDGFVLLPHQCQEWVIGKKADVIDMIRLLQELVDQWENEK